MVKAIATGWIIEMEAPLFVIPVACSYHDTMKNDESVIPDSLFSIKNVILQP